MIGSRYRYELSTCFFAFCLCLTAVGRAEADWVYWEQNGHYYDAVALDRTVSWANASLMANSMGGYLATITSAEENAFVFSLIDSPEFWGRGNGRNYGPWFGGLQASSGAEPTGGWSWITAESWSFTAWNSGEPNENRAGEDFLQFFTIGDPSLRTATWNDLHNDGNSLVSAFVVEAVPEASSLALLTGTALAILAGRYSHRCWDRR